MTGPTRTAGMILQQTIDASEAQSVPYQGQDIPFAVVKDLISKAQGAASSAGLSRSAAQASADIAAQAAARLPVYSDTPPALPVANQEWVNTSTGRKYSWYVDVTGGKWVEQAGFYYVDNPTAIDPSTLAASSGSSLVGFIQNATGSVSRTLQSRLRDTISVRDFGAKGDGTSDDTAAFVSALNYCETNKLSLVIPSGAYLLATWTTRNSTFVMMRGSSEETSIIVGPTAIGINFVTMTSGTFDVEGLHFKKFEYVGYSELQVDIVRIHRCRGTSNRTNFYRAADVTDYPLSKTTQVEITQNTITLQAGFQMHGACQFGVAIGNVMNNLRRDTTVWGSTNQQQIFGISFGDTDNNNSSVSQSLVGGVTITGNTIDGMYGTMPPGQFNTTNGIQVSAVSATVTGNVIKNMNAVDGTNLEAIYCKAQNMVISNNTIVDGTVNSASIALKGTLTTNGPMQRQIVCSNNVIVARNQSCDSGIVVFAAGAADIMGNSISGLALDGIKVYGDPAQLNILNNHLYSMQGTEAITLRCGSITSTRVEGNTIDGVLGTTGNLRPVRLTVTPTQVSNITVTAGGSGYTSVPTVTISGGGGSATAQATISGGQVIGVQVNSSNTSFTSTPTVTISGGGGTGATATAVLSAGTINDVTIARNKIRWSPQATLSLACAIYLQADSTVAQSSGGVVVKDNEVIADSASTFTTIQGVNIYSGTAAFFRDAVVRGLFMSGPTVGNIRPVNFNSSQFYASQATNYQSFLVSELYVNGTKQVLVGSKTVNLMDFGASADGVVDDMTAFRAAVNYLNSRGGGVLILPDSTVRLVVTATNTVSIGSNITIQGSSSTVLSIDSDAPGSTSANGAFRQFIGLNGNNINFRDFKIVRAAPYAQFVLMVWGTAGYSGFRMMNVTIDGAVNVASSAYCHALQFGNSGTTTDLIWERCTLTNLSYTLLMTNGATGTVSRLTFDKCTLTNNYSDDLGFNSPNGSITDVVIRDCHFLNNQATGAGGGFAASFAHVTRGLVAGCDVTGYNNEAFHIEDWSQDITIEDCRMTLCGKLQGAYIRVISGASRVRVDRCLFDTSSNSNTNLNAFEALAGGTGTTPGGRSVIAPTYTTVNNCEFQLGTSFHGAYFEACSYYRFTNNNVVGSGTVNSGVYGGSIRRGLYCYTGANGVIANNMFRGLLWATVPATNGISAYGNGTSITGNSFIACALGLSLLDLDGGVTATGNSFNNCVKSVILGRGGATVYSNPGVVVGNTAFNCAYPMAISSPYTMKRTTSGTIAIGSGVSVPMLPTDVYMPSGTVLTFSGGGVLTLTAAANSQATSLTGNLTTASIAPNETATFTSALPAGTVVANNNG